MTKTEPVTKQIEDLAKGEVWSIHPKARKFVLANIDPETNVIESTDIDGMKTITMPYSEHRGSTVFSHGNEMTPVNPWTPALWQRVGMNGGEERRQGTIIDTLGAEVPAVEVVVLWDAPADNRWMTQQDLKDISLIQQSCDTDSLQRAKEARALIKDLQAEHEKASAMDPRKAVQQDMAKAMASKAEYRKASELQKSKKVQVVAKHVIDAYASDFKAMIEAGMLSLTAGEEEGEIDRIPEMIDSHLDSIKVKVDAATTDEDLKIPAVVAITQIMADTMLNQYFLTRKAFIRAKNDRYALVSNRNEKLGVHANKRSAIRQLRLIEYKHRHGLGD
jgi:hypothetical protein